MKIDALPPGSVIGIVGGGQLGRMMALAAAKLGLRASIFAPERDSPAFEVAAYQHCAPYEDADALQRFADQADAVTFEFENIPSDALAIIEQRSRLSPPRRALEVAQDRLEERRFLKSLDLPVSPYEEIIKNRDLPAAWERLSEGRANARLFLKKSRLGYDGKGQMRIESPADVDRAQDWLGDDAALMECGVDFQFEMSVLCVRDGLGNVAFYESPRNVHEGGILRESIVPAPLADGALETIRGYAERIASALDYAGVLAVEMFSVDGPDGFQAIINEIAPRVHNSGHWTLEACAVSQFENHIRAVAGWPLGSTERHSNARMVNLLGDEANGWRELLAENPARSLTLYGKGEARAGRKMGHYTELAPR